MRQRFPCFLAVFFFAERDGLSSKVLIVTATAMDLSHVQVVWSRDLPVAASEGPGARISRETPIPTATNAREGSPSAIGHTAPTGPRSA